MAQKSVEIHISGTQIVACSDFWGWHWGSIQILGKRLEIGISDDRSFDGFPFITRIYFRNAVPISLNTVTVTFSEAYIIAHRTKAITVTHTVIVKARAARKAVGILLTVIHISCSNVILMISVMFCGGAVIVRAETSCSSPSFSRASMIMRRNLLFLLGRSRENHALHRLPGRVARICLHCRPHCRLGHLRIPYPLHLRLCLEHHRHPPVSQLLSLRQVVLNLFLSTGGSLPAPYARLEKSKPYPDPATPASRPMDRQVSCARRETCSMLS